MVKGGSPMTYFPAFTKRGSWDDISSRLKSLSLATDIAPAHSAMTKTGFHSLKMPLCLVSCRNISTDTRC